jgi:hypothetical protein
MLELETTLIILTHQRPKGLGGTLAIKTQVFGVLQNKRILIVCNVVFAIHFKPPQFKKVDHVGGFKGVNRGH